MVQPRGLEVGFARSRAAHIVIVEAAPGGLCPLLQAGLEEGGYRVSARFGSPEALCALDARQVDVIAIDFGCGIDDGLRLVADIRDRWEIPVIVITEPSDAAARAAALERGADDCLVKPFHVRELLQRIGRALSHRNDNRLLPGGWEARPTAAACHECLAFAGHAVDVAARTLTAAASGESIDLTSLEFDLLLGFLHRPGHVLSRDDLTQQIKGHDWSPGDRSIGVHVGHLRRKLQAGGSAPLIKSVRCVGYVFVADVHRI